MRLFWGLEMMRKKSKIILPSPKWNIKSKVQKLKPKERQVYWEEQADSYKDNVYSITQDHKFQKKVKLDLKISTRKAANVLIPGCGVITDLQECLVNERYIKKITCVDYSKIIKCAKKTFIHNKVIYKSHDIIKMNFKSEWDAVILVNVAVAENHLVNKEILKSCYKALKPDGILIAVFPTVFCALELFHITGNGEFVDNLDLEQNLFYEKTQGVKQMLYTPIRLRYLIREVGLKILRFELIFLDSEIQLELGKHIYGLDDKDAVVYQHYVVAKK